MNTNRILLLTCTLLFTPILLSAEEPITASPPQKLTVVSLRDFSDAQRLATATLQGLANRESARIWIESSGMNHLILEDLKREGWDIQQQNDFWELLTQFRDHFQGAVVCKLGTESVNTATSFAGIDNLIALDESLLDQWKSQNLPVKKDVRETSEPDNTYTNVSSPFNAHWVVHQNPQKSWHLRDFAVAEQAFTFFEEDSSKRIKLLEKSQQPATVLGWGSDEKSFVRDASKAGGAVIAADWSLNLSALKHLKTEIPVPPTSSNIEVHEGERIIAFVISDGDNIQWMGGSFVERTGFWASPRRGTFPVNWEMAPSLASLAPRVMERLYKTAIPGQDEFIAGPSGHAYHFPSQVHNPNWHADQTAIALKQSHLRISTILNDGGSMQDAEPILAHPDVDAVFYKDWAPYNKRKGAVEWFYDKPCVAYRFLLWEPQRKNSPEGISQALSRMPADPIHDPDSFALINVHAWSWKSIGGPMEAIHRTIQLAPEGTRVVTASQFVELLKGCIQPH